MLKTTLLSQPKAEWHVHPTANRSIQVRGTEAVSSLLRWLSTRAKEIATQGH